MTTKSTEEQPIRFNESNSKSEVSWKAINLAETINKALEAELSCVQAIQSLEKVSKDLVSPENRAAAEWHLGNSRKSLVEASRAYASELADLIGANYKQLGPDFLGESYGLYDALGKWETYGTQPPDGLFTPELLGSLKEQYDPQNPKQALRVGNFLVIPESNPQLTALIEGKVYIRPIGERYVPASSDSLGTRNHEDLLTTPAASSEVGIPKAGKPPETTEEIRDRIRREGEERRRQEIDDLVESNRRLATPIVEEWERKIQAEIASGNLDEVARLREQAFQETFSKSYSYKGIIPPTSLQLREAYNRYASEAQAKLAQEAKEQVEKKKAEEAERDRLRRENVSRPWDKKLQEVAPAEAPTEQT